LQRQWFNITACADLLKVDAHLAKDDTLYRVYSWTLDSNTANSPVVASDWSGGS